MPRFRRLTAAALIALGVPAAAGADVPTQPQPAPLSIQEQATRELAAQMAYGQGRHAPVRPAPRIKSVKPILIGAGIGAAALGVMASMGGDGTTSGTIALGAGVGAALGGGIGFAISIQ